MECKNVRNVKNISNETIKCIAMKIWLAHTFGLRNSSGLPACKGIAETENFRMSSGDENCHTSRSWHFDTTDTTAHLETFGEDFKHLIVLVLNI